MVKIFRVAIPSFEIMTLSACGCGDGKCDIADNRQATNPIIPVTADIITPKSVPFNLTQDGLNTVENQQDAAKFLYHTTFDPIKNTIDELVNSSTYESWIKGLFNTNLHST